MEFPNKFKSPVTDHTLPSRPDWRSVLVVVAMLSFLAGPHKPASATEVLSPADGIIEVTEGWNYIALPVVPPVRTMQAILGAFAEHIILVKDVRGNTFIPEFGIDAIGEWDAKQAYMINARSPFSLLVTGAPVSPEQTPIELHEGWNLIPYFASKESDISTALASIIDHVVIVKDYAGNVFYPEYGLDAIETLKPGQGYMVFVSSRQTLRFPAGEARDNGDRLVVNTIAEAIALTGMQVGDEVEVLGYHEPGDGGGGMFVVDDSGDEIDGGTVFSFLEHEVEREVYVNKNFLVNTGTRTLHPDIVYGSLRFYYNENGEYFPDELLHGHRLGNATGPTYPLVDYKRGILRGYHSMLSGSSVELAFPRVTFRTNDTGIRLQRIFDLDYLSIDWFGAVEADRSNPQDMHHIVAHTINTAFKKGMSDVLVPRRYYYHGPIEIKDGMTLFGLGVGTSALIVIPELVLQHRLRGSSNRDEKRRDLHQHYTVIMTHGDAHYARIKDLEIDGNYRENLRWYTHPEEYTQTIRETIEELQNTPSWNGFVSTTHGNRQSHEGLKVAVENAHIHGFGGNVLMSNAVSNARWEVRNSRFGSSLRNHVLYGAQGYFENITIHGFAWGTFLDLYQNTHINGLFFEDGEPNPVDAPYTGLINFRGDAGTTASTLIENFDLDFAGSARNMNAFTGLGNNIVIRNGIARGARGREIRLFVENGNGFQRPLWRNNLFENIELEVVGNGGAYVLGASNSTGINTPALTNLSLHDSEFRNIRVVTSEISEPRAGMPSLWIRAWHRNHSSWNEPQELIIEDFHDEVGSNFLLKTDVHADALGLDLHIRRSTFRNSTPRDVFVNVSHNSSKDPIQGDLSKLRVFFDDVEFNVSANSFNSSRIFPHVARFNNCRTPDGLTSEDAGTFEFTASGGETSVDIPTTLFWHSSVHDVRTAPVKEVESVRNNGGTYLRVHFEEPLANGQRVNLDWSAAVRPFDL